MDYNREYNIMVEKIRICVRNETYISINRFWRENRIGIPAFHICSCTSAFLRLSAYEYEGAAKVRGTKEYSCTSLKHAVHTIRREKGSVFIPVEAKRQTLSHIRCRRLFFMRAIRVVCMPTLYR